MNECLVQPFQFYDTMIVCEIEVDQNDLIDRILPEISLFIEVFYEIFKIYVESMFYLYSSKVFSKNRKNFNRKDILIKKNFHRTDLYFEKKTKKKYSKEKN